MFLTVLLNWFLLSSFEDDTIEQEVNVILNQSNELTRVLENAEYFSTDKQVESPWEIGNCVSLMQSLYEERVLLVQDENVLYDTKGADLTEVITNSKKADGKDVLSEKEMELLTSSYEAKQGLFSRNGNMLSVVVPIYKEYQKLEETGFVIVRTDLNSVLRSCQSVREKAITIEIVVLVLLFILAFFYSGKVIKPLRKLLVYIERVTEGFMDERVTLKSYREIDDVVDAINHMTTKLETLENSRQEFVSNVSHELKTPITSIKVLADSLLQQEDAPAELYREFLSDINAEIERENKIITDLLSLVKMDKTAGELNISSININELLEQILKRIKPIAAGRNIELIFESYRPVMAEVDEVKLSLAVNNLIENAVKYNYDNGWVRVSLNADHKFFYIKVSDSGVGIPEDEQENVFERFYRVDKARSRETGGTGLGLSITRNAILMHRGAIKIYSKEKEGTTFTVRIPLNYAG